MENECEALPGVVYPGVRDNRSTINTKTGYDDDDDVVNGKSRPLRPRWYGLPIRNTDKLLVMIWSQIRIMHPYHQ